jgi:hypothetical protein
MPSAYVQDGHTYLGRVPALPPLHDDYEFHYRPALFHVRNVYQAAAPEKSGEVAARIAADHLVDLKHGGEELPVTVELVKKLLPDVLQSILFHVLCYTTTPADADPGNSPPG